VLEVLGQGVPEPRSQVQQMAEGQECLTRLLWKRLPRHWRERRWRAGACTCLSVSLSCSPPGELLVAQPPQRVHGVRRDEHGGGMSGE